MAETKTEDKPKTATTAEAAPKAESKPKEPTKAEKEAIQASLVPPTPTTGEPVEVKKGQDAVAEGAAPVPVTTAVVHPEGTEDEAQTKEAKELPLAASNGSFYATLDANANGIPTVSVLPRGWVGPAPLQISEDELKDLIAVLTKLKR